MTPVRLDPDALLTELAARGVLLIAADDHLKIDAPAGVITPELREQLIIHKPAILAHLSGFAPADLRADPRPDLSGDSLLWSRLLSRSWEFDGPHPLGCFGALLGIRCCGAQLVLLDGQARIMPGEVGSEYAILRSKWLLPHEETIRWLLAELSSHSATT